MRRIAGTGAVTLVGGAAVAGVALSANVTAENGSDLPRRMSLLGSAKGQPAQIATEIDRLGIDPARLWIGIGSGPRPPRIDLLQRAVAELRDTLPPTTRIVVVAMRPQFCRLTGALADGALVNWMLPDQLAEARRWLHEGADDAGRAAPVVAAYVRVAVGSGSLHPPRLAVADRHLLAWLPQVEWQQLATTIDRALKGAWPRRVARAHLSDVVIDQRLAADEAQLADQLKHPDRRQPRILAQLSLNLVVERIEFDAPTRRT